MKRLAPQEIRFEEEMHCCGPQDRESTFAMSRRNGGADDGDTYLTLCADEWAFDSLSQIDEFCAILKNFAVESCGLVDKTPPITIAGPITNCQTYAAFVASMWQHGNTMSELGQLKHAGVGLGEEMGEVLGLIKKAENKPEWADTPEYRAKMAMEAGDVLFYLSVILSRRGLTLLDAMNANEAKLSRRHVEGSLLDPAKRDVAAETAAVVSVGATFDGRGLVWDGGLNAMVYDDNGDDTKGEDQ